MKKDISYGIMSFDSDERPEYPIIANTDNGARRQAKKTAEQYGIENYSIVFYRKSDGCRGSLDK